MRLFEHIMLFPVYLGLFLWDAAILFLIIQLLSRVCPVRPLLWLSAVGSKGVDGTVDLIIRGLWPWLGNRLSRRQEEVVALLILALARVIADLLIRRAVAL